VCVARGVQRRELTLLHQQVVVAKKQASSTSDSVAATAVTATTPSGVDTVMAAARALKDRLAQEEEAVTRLEGELHTAIRAIGNVVAPDVLESRDEADNVVLRTWGSEQRLFNPAVPTATTMNVPSSAAPDLVTVDFPLLHHHQLLHMIDGYDADRGASGVQCDKCGVRWHGEWDVSTVRDA
jgi:seryl-tRNA synthetase